MTIEYELSEKNYFIFLKKYFPNTTYFKKTFITYLILSILLIPLTILFDISIIIILLNVPIIPLLISFILILFILLMSFILILFIFRFIIKLKKTLLYTFEKNTIKLSSVFLHQLILTIHTDTLTIHSKYQDIKIPFEKLDSLYILDNYILITNKVLNDILIPINVFSSNQFKTDFLNLFKEKNINFLFSFPKDYIFK